ncbi:hypothetical protein C922_03296 [Plasmodium inui San Antonio 1]|uniref:Uncharacterized protein n=1 Tax=Plasmodium inui San Antonio 1 TaxID=1237626 RepID=W7A3Z3_9APIC|nr:hypothetical protein C922_03296 [Plasmodium inui San Antonio 1]EUD66380.1 hypothetical protein C922_03296 [Plasmodium inui San Antonio 1]
MCMRKVGFQKRHIHKEQYAEEKWSDKPKEHYQKATTDYVIEATTKKTSTSEAHKTKQKVHNHESCVLTKKELITKVRILILMTVPVECKGQEDLQNMELYLWNDSPCSF